MYTIINPKKFAVFLMGPTASGKTALAIEIAQKFPVQIISVDSSMIYRNMNIGTNKPTTKELLKAPHALIDILEPFEVYSAAQFCNDAHVLMQQSIQQQKIPLLVGGTMMYYHALENGLSELPSSDPKIRKQLSCELENYGLAKLYTKLQVLDPIAANKINSNDPQRIMRALEVIEITGKQFSAQLVNRKPLLSEWKILKIALFPERKKLHDQIEIRFIQMLELGLIEEITILFRDPKLHENLPSIRSVGYRQGWQYMQGKISRQEMIFQSIVATRQLAKRQYTWLRKHNDAHFIDDPQNASDLIMKLIEGSLFFFRGS